MRPYACPAAVGPIDAIVEVPGSKSLTNRALVCAGLAGGTSVLSNVLLAEDTHRMIEALRTLGVAVTTDEAGKVIELTGCGGRFPETQARLFCGNSGTCMRFLTAAVAASHGRYTLDGVARMRRRPIGGLTSALQALGAKFEFHVEEGFPPLTVHADGLRGGETVLESPRSSQMVSAILLAAPQAAGDVFVEVGGDLPSRPFIGMTVMVMERFGIEMLESALPDSKVTRYVIEAPRRYQAATLAIEPDATNATYFFAAAAVTSGRVTVPGLHARCLQGDHRFVEVLCSMGCSVQWLADRVTVTGPAPGRALHGVDVDLNAMPDTVQTLAVLALFAEGPTTIRNVANLRVKETDRLRALSTELTRLGAVVEERDDGLVIQPPTAPRAAAIDTYDDHRMAMSFAVAGLRCRGLTINDPDCCAKTFPDFFARWERMLGSDRS